MKKKKKWWAILLFVLFGIAVMLYIVFPAGMGVIASTRQTLEPATPPDGFEAISLTASDDVHLSAWYKAPDNGAVIVLVHGSAGSLESIREYANMLSSHDYGILALGLRGHGSSGGSGNTLGWECDKDIKAAVDYLNEQSDVKNIGALGLSLGGEVLLSTCSDFPEIAAIVSDGGTHHTIADYLSMGANQSLWRSFTTRVMYASAELFTGQKPPETTILASIKFAADTKLLFIAAGNVADEVDYNTMFSTVTAGRSELWIVPDAGHTQGFFVYPDAYETRVTDFFDAALLGGEG